MRKGALLVLSLFLMVFMVGSVSAKIISTKDFHSNFITENGISLTASSMEDNGGVPSTPSSPSGGGGGSSTPSSPVQYYLESGEPIKCYGGYCLHQGTVHYWDDNQKIYVGNFSIVYQGATAPYSKLYNSQNFTPDLYLSNAYGEINFTINEDFFEGKLRGLSIKDFRGWDLLDPLSYHIINRTISDSLFWETGYLVVQELTKNKKERYFADLQIVSSMSWEESVPNIPTNYTYAYESNLVFWKDSQDTRISTLESWKTTITDTITQIWAAITGHSTRIDALESSSGSGGGSGGGGGSSNATFPNYFKYLSDTDRKNMVCEYAQDNHLDTYVDLGWGCVVTYKQTSRGETASCRCKETPAGSAVIIPPFYLNTWKAATTGITLEISNLGGEDYTLRSLAISNCGTLNLNNKKINSNNYQSIRVPCKLTRGNWFNGDITLTYNKIGSSVDLTSTGTLSETVA